MDFLNQNRVLRLNSNYMRIGWSTAKAAFIAMNGPQSDGTPPALALDIEYEYDEFGKPITDKMTGFQRMEWDYWIMLDARRGDLDKVVHTSKRIIRIPTIIVCPKYYAMPIKEQRPTASSIRERDGNRCQYTGVPLSNKTFSLDHIIPKSKGGKDNWHNLVAAHKDVNSRKGDKFNHEAGLKLLKHPRAPKSIPLCQTVKGNFHPDHEQFP
jgi:5-methylcytosine-specific restriction endonuclease McrA